MVVRFLFLDKTDQLVVYDVLLRRFPAQPLVVSRAWNIDYLATHRYRVVSLGDLVYFLGEFVNGNILVLSVSLPALLLSTSCNFFNSAIFVSR